MSRTAGFALVALVLAALGWSMLLTGGPPMEPPAALELPLSGHEGQPAGPGGAGPTAAKSPSPPVDKPAAAAAVAADSQGRGAVAEAQARRTAPPAQQAPPRESPSAAWDRQQAQADRNDFQYQEAGARFDEEQVDAQWAGPRQQAIADLAKEWGVPEILSAVECRSTLCRVSVGIQGETFTDGVLRAGPLLHALGGDAAKANEYGGEDRHVVLYLPREGHPLPEPPAPEPPPEEVAP